jgi:hypothetical protein
MRCASRQGKAYELRAATSLARLRGEQGRRTEARDLLCRSSSGSGTLKTRSRTGRGSAY